MPTQPPHPPPLPPPRVGKHSFRDIDDAPNGAGVYAWYAIAPIGRRDWEQNVINGHDTGAEAFLKLLSTHTKRFANVTLSVSATSSFTTNWQGSLEDQSIAALATLLQGNAASDANEKSLTTTINSCQLREIFANTLNHSSPTLASPLYIGKAKCLNTRLRKHRDRISVLQQRCIADPSYLSLPPETNIFADRAVRLGLDDSTLEVHTWDLTPYLQRGFSMKDLSHIARSLELLLNRWHRPLLGRR